MKVAKCPLVRLSSLMELWCLEDFYMEKAPRRGEVWGCRRRQNGLSCLVKWNRQVLFLRFLCLVACSHGQRIDSGVKEDSKEAGLIVLKIKRIKCITPRAPNPIQAVPSTGALGMRKDGDLCIGYGIPFHLHCFASIHVETRFGDEIQVDAQHGATWEVSSFESDKPGIKPRTYVSFVFRYRSPGNFSLRSVVHTHGWSTVKNFLMRRV